MTALAVGPEGALAQRPPDKIRASHLSRGLALGKSDWQKALTRRTQKPFAPLWKVTRSTRPAKTSVGCPSWVAAPSP